ncbi:MAG: tRNA-dihydrouridine synthase 3 [Icmadophila ericetorum]|nr:tRNA-dihydrouridine synthase 3 [Icmadophila ericetorum]
MDLTDPLNAEQAAGTFDELPNPVSTSQVHDSAVSRAEKFERPRMSNERQDDESPPSKRVKLESPLSESIKFEANGDLSPKTTPSERQKGVAPIKAEYLVYPPGGRKDKGATINGADTNGHVPHVDARDRPGRGGGRKKEKGSNTSRQFGSSRDKKGLCLSRATQPEFSPDECKFGDGCRFEHDLRVYLEKWKREDLKTFEGKCPIWEVKGRCNMGWKCRFLGSHMRERETEDGRKELVLLESDHSNDAMETFGADFDGADVVNSLSSRLRDDLMKKRVKNPKADAYLDWLKTKGKDPSQQVMNGEAQKNIANENDGNGEVASEVKDLRAEYTEAPFLPSEKRRLYYGPETPILAPLTTQGNLPFRRLCVELGAQLTYSEMAMSLPLLQGQKSEWALMRAHKSELPPPRYTPNSVVVAYDNSTDLKFGAQIAANKQDLAIKATEVLTQVCPQLRDINLNCGCPIDLVYRSGGGSALLDNQAKLERILSGMNAVSEEIPITVKIRMGTKDGKPTAKKLIDRLLLGGKEASGLSSGVAAITLHGRSRQQRYTRNADWEYISECAESISSINREADGLADTTREMDNRHRPATCKVYFIGNGDCYSHVDYYNHLEKAKVDSVMVARGALVKPWIFEEIEKGQYLDKSATERLAIYEKYARYGLETWGSDEMGVGTTRRFLLEWLSFAYRYVPVGILEHLPPSLQDRPPAWKGRNELETLLGSANYKDWIKISEMFLGPATEEFKFEPKHKSNSYEIEAEG